MPSSGRIVVGITGASGAAYAVRTVETLVRAGVEVHLAVTALGRRLLNDELGMSKLDPDELTAGRGDRLVIHGDRDQGAVIASGSFRTDGMIVVPCSSNSLGILAGGITEYLAHRAAAVTLKEKRPLVIATRESPLTSIDLENMQRLDRAGATIAPLSPGFYLLPRSIDDIVDFMVGRLLDLVGVDHDLAVRWEGEVPG